MLLRQNHGMDLAEALSIPCWLLKLCPDEPTRDVPPFGEAPSRFGWLNLLRHYLRLGVMVRAAGRTKFTELQNKFRREVCGIGGRHQCSTARQQCLRATLVTPTCDVIVIDTHPCQKCPVSAKCVSGNNSRNRRS